MAIVRVALFRQGHSDTGLWVKTGEGESFLTGMLCAAGDLSYTSARFFSIGARASGEKTKCDCQRRNSALP